LADKTVLTMDVPKLDKMDAQTVDRKEQSWAVMLEVLKEQQLERLKEQLWVSRSV
jgi:hypothetical protein